jgi:hypothetical protein
MSITHFELYDPVSNKPEEREKWKPDALDVVPAWAEEKIMQGSFDPELDLQRIDRAAHTNVAKRLIESGHAEDFFRFVGDFYQPDETILIPIIVSQCDVDRLIDLLTTSVGGYEENKLRFFFLRDRNRDAYILEHEFWAKELSDEQILRLCENDLVFLVNLDLLRTVNYSVFLPELMRRFQQKPCQMLRSIVCILPYIEHAPFDALKPIIEADVQFATIVGQTCIWISSEPEKTCAYCCGMFDTNYDLLNLTVTKNFTQSAGKKIDIILFARELVAIGKIGLVRILLTFLSRVPRAPVMEIVELLQECGESEYLFLHLHELELDTYYKQKLKEKLIDDLIAKRKFATLMRPLKHYDANQDFMNVALRVLRTGGYGILAVIDSFKRNDINRFDLILEEIRRQNAWDVVANGRLDLFELTNSDAEQLIASGFAMVVAQFPFKFKGINFRTFVKAASIANAGDAAFYHLDKFRSSDFLDMNEEIRNEFPKISVSAVSYLFEQRKFEALKNALYANGKEYARRVFSFEESTVHAMLEVFSNEQSYWAMENLIECAEFVGMTISNEIRDKARAGYEQEKTKRETRARRETHLPKKGKDPIEIASELMRFYVNQQIENVLGCMHFELRGKPVDESLLSKEAREALLKSDDTEMLSEESKELSFSASLGARRLLERIAHEEERIFLWMREYLIFATHSELQHQYQLNDETKNVDLAFRNVDDFAVSASEEEIRYFFLPRNSSI